MNKIEILEEYLTQVKYDCLRENSYAIILYNIIQNRLSPNHLQRIVIDQTLYHNIIIIGNKYHNRNDQLLFYIKDKKILEKT